MGHHELTFKTYFRYIKFRRYHFLKINEKSQLTIFAFIFYIKPGVELNLLKNLAITNRKKTRNTCLVNK